MRKCILIFVALLLSSHAFAEDIEVPEEELGRETTLPVFSKRQIVLNRNVVTTQKYEFGLGGGLEMNEPFYSQWMGQIQGTYNFTDVSAVNIQGLFWTSGLSSYAQQLKQGRPTDPNAKFDAFDASKAPHPVWGIFANYEYVAYYGKISLTKQTVMNLNTFGLAGVGYINMNTANAVGVDFGVGQNFFFTKSVGLRWDLRWLVFQGPDATSQALGPTNNPSASSFSNRIYFNTQLGLGLVFIL